MSLPIVQRLEVGDQGPAWSGAARTLFLAGRRPFLPCPPPAETRRRWPSAHNAEGLPEAPLLTPFSGGQGGLVGPGTRFRAQRWGSRARQVWQVSRCRKQHVTSAKGLWEELPVQALEPGNFCKQTRGWVVPSRSVSEKTPPLLVECLPPQSLQAAPLPPCVLWL